MRATHCTPGADRIANKHHTDKGSLYFNAHGYAAIYESLLRHRRNEDLHILELGLLRHDVQARNPLADLMSRRRV